MIVRVVQVYVLCVCLCCNQIHTNIKHVSPIARSLVIYTKHLIVLIIEKGSGVEMAEPALCVASHKTHEADK